MTAELVTLLLDNLAPDEIAALLGMVKPTWARIMRAALRGRAFRASTVGGRELHRRLVDYHRKHPTRPRRRPLPGSADWTLFAILDANGWRVPSRSNFRAD